MRGQTMSGTGMESLGMFTDRSSRREITGSIAEHIPSAVRYEVCMERNSQPQRVAHWKEREQLNGALGSKHEARQCVRVFPFTKHFNPRALTNPHVRYFNDRAGQHQLLTTVAIPSILSTSQP